MGTLRTRTVDAMGRQRRKDDSNIAPFLTTRLAAFTHLLLNVLRSKRFLSHLILTLSWCRKYKKKDHDEKSLHRHKIPYFASSRSPFELQLASRETPHASHPETEEERCLRRTQRRAARAVWVRCEPSTPRRNPWTGELARSSRSRAQPFLPTHCRSECNRACLPGSLFSDPAVSKTVAKNRWSTLWKALDWSKLISAASVSSSMPSRISRINCRLSWIDLPFTA